MNRWTREVIPKCLPTLQTATQKGWKDANTDTCMLIQSYILHVIYLYLSEMLGLHKLVLYLNGYLYLPLSVDFFSSLVSPSLSWSSGFFFFFFLQMWGICTGLNSLENLNTWNKIMNGIENTVAKGEIAHYKQFFISIQYFQNSLLHKSQNVSACGKGSITV